MDQSFVTRLMLSKAWRSSIVIKLKSLAKFAATVILLADGSFLKIQWMGLFLLLWAAGITESLNN